MKFDSGYDPIQRKTRRCIPDSVVKYILAKRIGVVIRVIARIFVRCHFIDGGSVLGFRKTVEIGTSVAQ